MPARLGDAEVELWEKAFEENQATRSELSLVRHKAAFTHYQLAIELGEDAPDSRLKATIETLDRDWVAVKGLMERGGATVFHELFAHRCAVNARLPLLHIENDKDEVRSLLEELVELDQQLVTLGRETGWGTWFPPNARDTLNNLVQLELQRDRTRFAFVSNGRKLPEALLLADLDP